MRHRQANHWVSHSLSPNLNSTLSGSIIVRIVTTTSSETRQQQNTPNGQVVRGFDETHRLLWLKQLCDDVCSTKVENVRAISQCFRSTIWTIAFQLTGALLQRMLIIPQGLYRPAATHMWIILRSLLITKAGGGEGTTRIPWNNHILAIILLLLPYHFVYWTTIAHRNVYHWGRFYWFVIPRNQSGPQLISFRWLISTNQYTLTVTTHCHGRMEWTLKEHLFLSFSFLIIYIICSPKILNFVNQSHNQNVSIWFVGTTACSRLYRCCCCCSYCHSTVYNLTWTTSSLLAVAISMSNGVSTNRHSTVGRSLDYRLE